MDISEKHLCPEPGKRSKRLREEALDGSLCGQRRLQPSCLTWACRGSLQQPHPRPSLPGTHLGGGRDEAQECGRAQHQSQSRRRNPGVCREERWWGGRGQGHGSWASLCPGCLLPQVWPASLGRAEHLLAGEGRSRLCTQSFMPAPHGEA